MHAQFGDVGDGRSEEDLVTDWVIIFCIHPPVLKLVDEDFDHGGQRPWDGHLYGIDFEVWVLLIPVIILEVRDKLLRYFCCVAKVFIFEVFVKIVGSQVRDDSNTIYSSLFVSNIFLIVPK